MNILFDVIFIEGCFGYWCTSSFLCFDCPIKWSIAPFPNWPNTVGDRNLYVLSIHFFKFILQISLHYILLYFCTLLEATNKEPALSKSDSLINKACSFFLMSLTADLGRRESCKESSNQTKLCWLGLWQWTPGLHSESRRGKQLILLCKGEFGWRGGGGKKKKGGGGGDYLWDFTCYHLNQFHSFIYNLLLDGHHGKVLPLEPTSSPLCLLQRVAVPSIPGTPDTAHTLSTSLWWQGHYQWQPCHFPSHLLVEIRYTKTKIFEKILEGRFYQGWRGVGGT